jgi:hypothetical protein
LIWSFRYFHHGIQVGHRKEYIALCIHRNTYWKLTVVS